MTTVTLLLLARVLHILGGVIWAGSMFALSFAIIPIAARHADDGAGRWTAQVSRRLGPVSGISAVVTVLSGMYLFATLHKGDMSVGGIVLGAGAAAAVLSLLVGVLIGRPTGLRMAKLQSEGSNQSAATLAELASLRGRVAWSSRLAGILLGLAVLSMAVFRYAPAFAAAG
ncbi:MAG TPA: hypothetical protein VGD45_22990 [Steroidobacter sp.]|uniref:hypothetical protein n=1 Tax=Steroidobacter sp. TaxID=1978227 RepID=UPI002ED9BFF2